MDMRSRHEWLPVAAIGVSVHARAWAGPAGGVPLVLVAGLGVSSRYWVRLGRRLGGKHAVLAPDLPGFGRTPPPPAAPWPAGPSVREQADQLLAWMDARGIDQAVLCGHSVGCQTVVDLATRFPERVDRVILAAPPFEPGRRSLPISLVRLAIGALFEVVSLPLLLGVDYASAGPARAVQQAVRTMDYPMERVLPQVAVPTLVVHGACDPLVSRRWVERVARLVPGSKLVVVEQVGHAMHYSATTVTAAVIGAFIGDRLGSGTVVPRDDPQHDPLGPWQPVSPITYAAASGLLAMSFAALGGVRIRRLRGMAAAVSLFGCVRHAPMVTRTTANAACGAALAIASVTAMRRERAAIRWATAALGLGQLALAVLAAKPTGPGRACSSATTGDARTGRSATDSARKRQ